VVILEPTGIAGQVDAEAIERDRLFAEGLRLYRARDFAGAAALLSGYALADDGPAQRLAARAAALRDAPPGEDWRAVTSLEGK
jgi:hypothetical protein